MLQEGAALTAYPGERWTIAARLVAPHDGSYTIPRKFMPFVAHNRRCRYFGVAWHHHTQRTGSGRLLSPVPCSRHTPDWTSDEHAGSARGSPPGSTRESTAAVGPG